MYSSLIEKYISKGILPKELAIEIRKFCLSYQEALSKKKVIEAAELEILNHFIELVAIELQTPSSFDLYHQRVISPINYYCFGLDLMRPLIDFKKSSIRGEQIVEKISQQLSANENVILLANHQIEPDPQVIHIMLEDRFPDLAKNMIFVAGHRVITDPMAMPFSKGCNLLCIYSKKYIENPPEKKAEKLLHNQKTIKKMQQLLEEGGKCIYMAPSGGRDRVNTSGEIEVAPFDPQSIELFWLIARQVHPKTHFYPLALSTYHLLPPPDQINLDLGERRYAQCSPVHLAFGEEIDMINFSGHLTDKHQNRKARADYIFDLVKKLYSGF